MRRILVTGASGFLGRHLTLALGSEFVVALARDIEVESERAFPWVFTKLVRGGFDQVERAVAEYEVDTVVHLAAQTQVSTAAKHPVGTFEANVAGTWTVLEACRRQGVKRVVVASSDKVFGDGPTPYADDQLLQPLGVYAASKACADIVADAYRQEYGMSVATTRCGNLYGPGHTNWSTLIPGTIRSVLRGERPVLRSNGGPRRDFLFVEDAVDGYLRLLDGDAVGHFNMGTGRGTSALDVVRKILALAGSTLEPVVGSAEGPGAGGREIQDQACTYAAMAKLGWAPRHTLDQGLEKTIAWYQEFLGGTQ